MFTLLNAQSNEPNIKSKERTSFQTSEPWKPLTDVRADIAIVYGTHQRGDMSFEQRLETWREKGYNTHFMTGIAWGEYQDYFTGKWDGKKHLDEGQVTMKGDTIWHGYMVPYIVPSLNFLSYMKENIIKRVIDAGIDAIYLEEPEFWARAGYSSSFKKEWKDYYGFDWRPQHESAENTYLSNKLKYHLYIRALEECFSYAKEYGKSKGMNVRCYVPTHSLVNYSQWQIVSPEASLASLDCVDGYIAQVWTGTSREPNFYNGVRMERVFENAFLEYGCMESMTAPTKRKVFFLTDPIEDLPRDWEDYKKNYQATFTAKLMYPGNNNYEVMPWPDRIYEGLYRKSADSEEMARIPRFYSTQMQIMINTLNDVPLSENKVSGSSDISVLMANSMMFQRSPIPVSGYDDPQLSNFYGESLPLIKRGIPVNIMHLENTIYPDCWKNTKVLIMSYSNMKPLDEKFHKPIAEWVKKGGILIYASRDTDPFQNVLEWWNQKGNNFKRPSDHLFSLMGIKENPKDGEYKYGKGAVRVIREDPKEFILKENGDNSLLTALKKLYQTKNRKLIEKNNFTLTRGNYELIAVLDESVNHQDYEVKGCFVDLFNPDLPIVLEKHIAVGEQAYLYNLKDLKKENKPKFVAGACRIYDEKSTTNSYSFVAKSPKETTNVMRVYLPKEPKKIFVNDKDGNNLQNIVYEWNEQSKTEKIIFENDPEGISVTIEF
ncbi:MAG: hypothetical protein Q4F97_08390 [Bacteroidales bacterium]|nr:hypothetical protein [Bacteroidales bacterium]